MYDLVIAGAKLLDPETGNITENNSVAVKGERIAEVFTSGENESLRARSVIDAGGRLVLPGFIDFHVHIFAHGSTFGMKADDLISSGVTRAVDMGSAGWVNYPAMYDCDIAGKKPHLSTYINISPVGQPGKGISEPLEDSLMSTKNIARRMSEYPGMIRGLKVRISRGIVKELGIRPLVNAVSMAGELGLPVCVHPTDPPEDAAKAAGILRPGDVYSHTYNGRGSTILDGEGRVKAGILEARERGVLFEVGNGRINFTYPVAEAAARQNFFPDIISSDATPATFHNGPIMWDLPRVMSKFLNLGMTLADVVKAVTVTPARMLGISDRAGRIAEGYDADIVICRMDDGIIEFSDADGNIRSGRRGFVPEVVILGGEKVLSMAGESRA
ncbi:MAG: amidohydrolase family protein [Synergistaceae bacterium]|nr:amidohydrolase family protein [Synergistaceae bacterium]